MPTVLITGTNRGIGFEFARQYAADGWRVHATSRSPETCARIPGDVVTHHLDVCDVDSAASLRTAIEPDRLDVVINNAGVWFPEVETLETIDAESWDIYMRVHALGPLVVAQALMNSLTNNDSKLVNISSRSASMTLSDSNGYGYGASKAALDAITKSLAVDCEALGITVLALTPGWVRTDMGGQDANLSAEESVRGMRKVIADATLNDSGQFFAYDGERVPW
jgi:NAD(P)-dependent dehydrogenase (short-subunit alcohol dehydrogenase family)